MSAAPKATDEELVAAAVEGDEASFTELVRRYQRRLTGFLVKLVGNVEVARELTQDTFVKSWGALDRFNPEYRFSTWLFRIAHNCGIDHLRRKKLPTTSIHQTDRDGDEHTIDPIDERKGPLQLAENTELGELMRHAIEALRDDYKELVLLRHFGGLSYQEIADLKERPLGTIKNKLFRAHSVLRDALKERT